MPKVLLVDEARELVRLLTVTFIDAGYEVVAAFDPQGALASFRRERPDAVVVDANLGRWNGFDLLKQLRGFSSVPVVMLMERDDAHERSVCLALGADGCVSKPISQRDLLALVRDAIAEVQRQRSHPEARMLQVGTLVLDTGQRTVTVGGSRVSLGVIECRVLEHLMSHPDSPVGDAELASLVWGRSGGGAGTLVRGAVNRLRQKVGDDPARPRLVLSGPEGYRLNTGSLGQADTALAV